jgi:hypothetical protein
VRRTVATLLVVASPLLIAAPVGAREGRIAGSTGNPPAVAVTPAVPAAVPGSMKVTPSVPDPVPVAVTPSVAAPAATPALLAAVAATPAARVAGALRPAVRAVRATTPAPGFADDAYAAQLRADLCQARAIFCGLDRGGHYPAH